MKEILLALKDTLRFPLKDKVLLLLCFIPVTIGVTLYALVGHWIFGKLTSWGRAIIESHVQNQNFGTFLYYLVIGIFGLALFFIVNWTFFLVISIISAPINDLISERTERLAGGALPESMPFSWSSLAGKWLRLALNEAKKVFLILTLSLCALLLSFIPFVAPVGFILNANLMSVQFLDYSWSRHNLSFGNCVGDFRKNFLPYALSGIAFTLLMTIPILNLFFLPLAVIFYTNLWVKRRSLNS